MRELKACPFCNARSRIESNRDWHRLVADHDDDCIIKDYEITYSASEGQREYMIEDWNRRAGDEANNLPQE